MLVLRIDYIETIKVAKGNRIELLLTSQRTTITKMQTFFIYWLKSNFKISDLTNGNSNIFAVASTAKLFKNLLDNFPYIKMAVDIGQKFIRMPSIAVCCEFFLSLYFE